MKGLWGFDIPFVSATTPRYATPASKLADTRRRIGVRAAYLGLLLTITALPLEPFGVGKHGPFLKGFFFAAIGIGGYPTIARALRDLLQRRIGTAFCVSLALGSACSVGAYSVATTLALFALLTETIEDWTTKRGTRLLWTRFGLPCAEQTDESTLRLGMFERSTAVWLEQFFVYLAIAAAAVTLLTTGETKSAIAVLIVGSASALTASMSLLALGSAAQALLYGFRMKDEKFMERLATVDVAILDEIIGRDDVSHEKTAHAIRRLRDMKVETVLFTGALQPVGDAIGQQIGVNLIEAELFPEDKPCKIAGLQRRHRKIVFLGDGTNAGSSLAVADVSILTGPESQTYQAEADASFLGEDLNSFAEVLRLARRTNRIAAVSFAIAVIVTSVTVGLAIQGKVSPQWALAVRFALDLTLILSAAQLLTPLWKRRSALPFRL